MTKWFLYIAAALGFGVVLALGLPDAPPAQGNGYRVEVVGDLATARHVAVLVPGADTTPSTFDTGLGGVLRRAPGWQAHQLATAAGPGTAVVAWLGYDPPDGVNRSAVRSERAEAGAVNLVAYLDQLATQYPHATVTVIGHSYGTVVLGYAAARLPATVTDLVAIASPGMDVSRAADLHTHARLWAGSDRSDWTLRLPDLRILGAGHGTNPTRPGVGALPLDVHDADGHDGYFVPGTVSLASIARVVDGAQAVAQ
jgi:pimeloyl-ACP methyl ester carboxylesterase